MANQRLQKIVHEPYGLEHPYEQLLTERFPRDPVAGQPVALGVSTWPAGTADSVLARWRVEGKNGEATTEGEWVNDDEDVSYWILWLPALKHGEWVTYRLYARQGNRLISSEAFSFGVRGWLATGDMLEYRLFSEGIGLKCFFECTSLRPLITIIFQGPARLQLYLQMVADNNPISPFSGEISGLEESSSKSSPPSKTDYQVLEENVNQIVLATEELLLTIHRRPYRLEARRKDGSLVLEEFQPPDWLIESNGHVLEVRQTFISPPDEAFYGFGERYNALNQRGNKLDVRVFDQYKNQGWRTYLPVPFFFSSKGYGIYLQTSRYVAYDLAKTGSEQWSYTAVLGPKNGLIYDLIVADEPKTILKTHSHLTGLPSLPPVWAFGPWMSSNEWNSQAIVMEQVEKTFENNIPATVLVIEAWSDESTFYIWNDAQYISKPPHEPFFYSDFTFPSNGLWSDPKDMVEELHRRNIRVLLWQIPVMKRLDQAHLQHQADEAYMIKKGYYVHQADGQPYRVRPFWFRGGLVLDFTNPEAADWWLSKRAYLVEELGIDGFKTDGGEHLWGKDLRFADSRQGDELWNLYPNLYIGAYYNFAKEKQAGNAITFSRAGFTGAQRFPCHWAGDENSTWKSFRASILAGLNAGISGIPFWGWDLAGFSGEIPSAELYLRSAAMATFCPIMQYHSEYNKHRKPSQNRTPWNIQERTGDPDVIPIFRKFANLRMNLLPYIYNEAWKCSQSGLPLMRALPLEFPRDKTCAEFPYQYLFGEGFLVTPVVNEGLKSQPVYLPEGEWIDFWTDNSQQGPQVLNYATPKDIIPVFVKGGTILPMNLGETFELGEWVGNKPDEYQHLCFKIYPGDGDLIQEWFDAITRQAYQIRCVMSKETIQVYVSPIDYELSLRLNTLIPPKIIIDDTPIKRSPNFVRWSKEVQDVWYYDVSKKEVFVKLSPTRSTRKVVLYGFNN